MAMKSTIFKVDMQISDMDRHYYADHNLTLARHPSENDERMMLRLLAFALHADDSLTFTKGLCSDDEPDLWQKSLSDEIETWIDLGQPDEKRIRKACGRSNLVYVYSYNQRSARVWWEQVRHKLSRFKHLKVYVIADDVIQKMGNMAKRNMQLQYTIQDQEILLSDGLDAITIEIHPMT